MTTNRLYALYVRSAQLSQVLYARYQYNRTHANLAAYTRAIGVAYRFNRMLAAAE